jgi:putative membrane protein
LTAYEQAQVNHAASDQRIIMKKPLPDHQKASEHLAAERTFLAWVRTSIAVISLGFVVAKFGLWMRELATHLYPQMPSHSTGMSLPIGVAMMTFGGTLCILAAWHFHCVEQAIERGEVESNRGLIIAITAGVALLATVMIVYMLLTAHSI